MNIIYIYIYIYREREREREREEQKDRESKISIIKIILYYLTMFNNSIIAFLMKLHSNFGKIF